MNDEFKNEVFKSYDPRKIVPPCGACGGSPALALSMLDPKTGGTVRMYKCQCGEKTWSEDKKK